jgi:hypothetical protein
MSLIERFVRNFDLKLVHIHVNSGSPIRSDGLPLVVELSFSKNAQTLDVALLPHPLDMSNSKFTEDIKLSIDEKRL